MNQMQNKEQLSQYYKYFLFFKAQNIQLRNVHANLLIQKKNQERRKTIFNQLYLQTLFVMVTILFSFLSFGINTLLNCKSTKKLQIYKMIHTHTHKHSVFNTNLSRKKKDCIQHHYMYSKNNNCLINGFINVV